MRHSQLLDVRTKQIEIIGVTVAWVGRQIDSWINLKVEACE